MTSLAAALVRARAVQQALHIRSIDLPSGLIGFELATAQALHQDHLGLTTTSTITTTRGSTVSRKKRIKILVKHGLPATKFDAVTAHEMTHAWAQTAGIAMHGVTEEGVAELNSYWLLGRIGTTTAAAIQRQMLENTDPLYGAGLRLARAAERRIGWAALQTHLLRTGGLP